MRASCYTSTRIISCLYAPRRFTGTSETLGGFLLLQNLLTDTVATAPFMWLPRNALNRQCYTHTDGLLLQVQCIVCPCWKWVEFQVCLERAPEQTMQTLDSKYTQQSLIWLMEGSPLNCLSEEEHFSSSAGSNLFLRATPHAVSAGFSSPMLLICQPLKSPFIFKLAPSKVHLSTDC